jgi:hypothetical protein
MSHENVELVRRGVESVDAFWAMLDEYVIWDLRASLPMPDLDSVYVGRDAVIKASRHYWGTWSDYYVEAKEILDAGPSAVVILRERGRGKSSRVWGNEWCSWATIHRPSCLRSPSVSRRRAAGFSANSFSVPQRNRA